MTTQEEFDRRLDWEKMLDFTAGLTLTRPWYFMNDRDGMGTLRYQKIFTLYAKHDLIPGNDFEVEVLKFNRELFRKREYCITLRAKEESPAAITVEGFEPFISPKHLRRSWGHFDVTIGSDATRDKRLANFYESLRNQAIYSGTEQFVIHDVMKLLEYAGAKKK